MARDLTHLLIASLASGIGGLVWTLDEDFGRIERLTFGSRYDPSLA